MSRILVIWFLLLGVASAGPPFAASPRSPYRQRVFPPGAAGGGGAQSASDDFNRANETPAAGNWTTVTSETAFNLASNHLVPANDNNDCMMYYNAITPANNQWSQAAIISPGTGGGGQGAGVSVRVSTSARTYYRVVIDTAGANNVELTKMVAGVNTSLWIRTATYSAGAILKLSVTGTTLTVTYNGSAVGADTTDAAIASGRWGVCYSSTETGCQIDSWSGGEN